VINRRNGCGSAVAGQRLRVSGCGSAVAGQRLRVSGCGSAVEAREEIGDCLKTKLKKISSFEGCLKLKLILN